LLTSVLGEIEAVEGGQGGDSLEAEAKSAGGKGRPLSGSPIEEVGISREIAGSEIAAQVDEVSVEAWARSRVVVDSAKIGVSGLHEVG
jgi:hypothetical protein